jgi:hypothetical protein
MKDLTRSNFVANKRQADEELLTIRDKMDTEETYDDVMRDISLYSEEHIFAYEPKPSVVHKVHLPPADATLPNSKDTVKCNYGVYKRLREMYMMAYDVKLKRHYYTGFLGILICDNLCGYHVLDSWPCKVKMVFIIAKKRCRFCKRKPTDIPTANQVISLMAMDDKHYKEVPHFYYITSK